jgi:hypothetical protein
MPRLMANRHALAAKAGGIAAVGAVAIVGALTVGGAASLRLAPNKAGDPDTLSMRLTKDGRAIDGTRVALSVFMLDMDMGTQLMGPLPHTAPGTYSRREPALGMPGRWGMRFDIRPPRSVGFAVTVVDRMAG